jgi:hypothetical protein
MLKHFRVPGRLAVKLEELGVSVPVVLRKAGLPRDLFQQTRVLVSTGELFALWRAIDQVSSDPLIGVKLGVETKTERFHPMAIAALSTENLVQLQNTRLGIRSSPRRKRFLLNSTKKNSLSASVGCSPLMMSHRASPTTASPGCALLLDMEAVRR